MDELQKSKKELLDWMMFASYVNGNIRGLSHWVENYKDRLPKEFYDHFKEVVAELTEKYERLKHQYL